VEARLSRGEPPLSREAFAAAYAADPADIGTVEAFARQHGLRVVESSAARRTVRVAGRAAELAALFGVELLDCAQADGARFLVPSGQPQVPAELRDIVQAVFGLDTRPRAAPRHRYG
jgi:kumamolisin